MSKSSPKSALLSNTVDQQDSMIPPWKRPSLPRAPLVPDEILKRNSIFFDLDTRFRRAARFLQSMWLRDNGIATGFHVSEKTDGAVTMELGSSLSAEAARAGKNFMSSAIHSLVRRSIIMQEEGACIEVERLFGNALSSMPLVWNLFGPMALDLQLATNVFRKLLPNFVHSVEGFAFEHSPGRREDRFLADGSAVDLVLDVTGQEGEAAAIYVEVKYSEDMSGPAARLRPRYDQASRQTCLFKDHESPVLRSLPCEQLWREHMLAQLAVDNAIVPRAMFIVVSPRLNRRVNAAIRLYQNELIDADDRHTNRVEFRAVTLESVIDAIADAGETEISKALWARYADFERVYHLSLLEFEPEYNTNVARELTVTSEPSERRASKLKGVL
jgi:hypothetical protein